MSTREVVFDERFPARLKEVDRVSEMLRLWLQRQELRGQKFALELLLREALTNAVTHGCGENPDKTVSCRIVREYNELVYDIEDEGAGYGNQDSFTTASVSTDELLENITGRGVAILKQYADEIEIIPPGNRIVIRKKMTKEAGNMEDMRVERDGEKAVVDLKGDIVASRARETKQELKSLVEDGVTDLTINMASVEMVDSAGIGVLVATQNSLRSREGRMTVIHLNPDLLDLFKTMRLDYHFDISGD